MRIICIRHDWLPLCDALPTHAMAAECHGKIGVHTKIIGDAEASPII